ncbi:transcription initiation factor IID, 31kD subunit-domain-containing protein [Lophiotrema nucula]|uniref:Transcription initiation factor IID, 31kD subunit-domain-containing protein n=1 Tax=Lophiotrema nucula TaxID=690887 RepID=A0A6A5YK98_9PLEO|nr:transcription initiation factor IID, 31kD subunit-domain-containing protein [Lophiotrema nucula]
MASPAAAELPNGISTPPTTATAAQNPSPPTASSTQPNTQSQPLSQSQAINGITNAPAVPSFPSTSLQDTGTSKRPRDARLIHLLLANMGVHAYTERVPLQLLDFAYRYTSGILSDAIAYEPPTHASTSKKGAAKDDEGVSLNALRTAVAARAAHQFSPALPKDFMAELAAERNRIALPRVDREFGVRLPPERYCFTGVGWDIKEAWESETEAEEDLGDAGGVGSGGPVGGERPDIDVDMEDEEQDEEEFENAMGLGKDTTMTDA